MVKKYADKFPQLISCHLIYWSHSIYYLQVTRLYLQSKKISTNAIITEVTTDLEQIETSAVDKSKLAEDIIAIISSQPVSFIFIS